jgi:hypothetical protein
MTFIKNALAGMLVVGFLAVVVYGLYYGFQYLLLLFAGIQEIHKTVLFIGGSTVFLSAAMVAAALRGLGRRIRNRRLQEEKLIAYGNLINVWRALVNSSQGTLRPEERQALHDIESRLALAAAPRVLRQYQLFQEVQHRSGLQSGETARQLEKIILEIRRDMGYTDWAFKEYNLFDLFIRPEAGLRENPAPPHSPQPGVQMPSA